MSAVCAKVCCLVPCCVCVTGVQESVCCIMMYCDVMCCVVLCCIVLCCVMLWCSVWLHESHSEYYSSSLPYQLLVVGTGAVQSHTSP